jgi:hypothetical protein
VAVAAVKANWYTPSGCAGKALHDVDEAVLERGVSPSAWACMAAVVILCLDTGLNAATASLMGVKPGECRKLVQEAQPVVRGPGRLDLRDRLTKFPHLGEDRRDRAAQEPV